MKQTIARIYIITNKQNGMVYIGATKKSIESRLKSHYCNAKRCHYKHPSALIVDLKNMGIDSFSIECLEEVYDIDAIEKAENYWIKQYKGEKCYNKNQSVYKTSMGARYLRNTLTGQQNDK